MRWIILFGFITACRPGNLSQKSTLRGNEIAEQKQNPTSEKRRGGKTDKWIDEWKEKIEKGKTRQEEGEKERIRQAEREEGERRERQDRAERDIERQVETTSVEEADRLDALFIKKMLERRYCKLYTDESCKFKKYRDGVMNGAERRCKWIIKELTEHYRHKGIIFQRIFINHLNRKCWNKKVAVYREIIGDEHF